jgi:hypothetical protein
MSKDEPRKTRRHSPTQLVERPVTITTDAGPVTVDVVPKGRHYRVRIQYPESAGVDQPDAGVSDKPSDA